jgi:phage shock protein B
MTGALIVGIALGGIILFVVTVGLVIIGIIRAAKSGEISRKDKEAREEEARMIQEIYHGLSKMEKRVEALETILIERSKKEFRQ